VQAVEPLAASLDTPEFTPTPIPIAGLPAVITPLTLAAQEIFPSPLGGWQPRAMPGGGGSSPAAVSPAAGFGYMSLPPSTGEPFPTGILMPQQPGTATPPGSPGTAPAVYQVLAFSSPTNGFLWIQPGQIPDGAPVLNLSYVLPPGEATVPQIVWLIPSLPILPGFPGLSGGSATVVSGPVLLSAPVVTVGLESPNTPGLPSYASTLSGPTLPPTGIVPPDEDTSADTPEPGSLALLLAGALLLTCSRAIHPR
jgi:hypothetical protein